MSSRTFRRTTVRSIDGTTIAVDSIGTGPGLVILSGSLVSPYRYRRLARALAANYTAHVVHRQGRGASGPQRSDYTMDSECADVMAVLQATEPRNLFGHSFGGLVALQTTLRSSAERLRSVVVYEPAIGVDGSLPTAALVVIGAGRRC